jgi:uncharacterized protein YndB with AHSA1/START domain
MATAFQGSSEIVIRAGPERIYAILEDSTLLPRWATMVKSTTGKTERVGSIRTCQVEWEGRKDKVTERCIEAIPAKRIRWVMEKGPMKKMFVDVRFGFALELQDNHTTLLRLETLYEPKNILVHLLYSLMMRRNFDELRQALLGNLKNLIEAREVKR